MTSVASSILSGGLAGLGNAGLGNAGLGAPAAAGGGADSAAPFASVFRSLANESAGLEQQANQAVTGLLSGQGVELHDAMIATQKADMAFELALQVRNKAVAAYQQMMSMQF